MGFCRRCGDIVVGTRCKCGGTAVAPVVPWNQGQDKDSSNDPWSRTYVARDPSPTRRTTTTTTPSTSAVAASDPTKRFPRPPTRSTTSSQPAVLGNRISAHIASTTSQLGRPSSPLKHSVAAPEADILPSPSPYDKSLSKVYGSVLQSPESLATHSCAICASVFPPDATIYPDPTTTDVQRFLCRPCFTSNGGSKGNCPTCLRPVIALKSEGGFIEVDGKCWHKRCFNCEGCYKHIGDAPMVDLLGRPSCSDCFENCLKRDRTPKKRESLNVAAGSPAEDLGRKSRESSPTIAELEMRLGINKSRESSPSVDSTRFKHSPRMSVSAPFPQSPGSPSTRASLPSRSTSMEPSSPTPPSRGKYERFKPGNLTRRSVDLTSPVTSPDTTPQKATTGQKLMNRFSSPAYTPDHSPRVPSSPPTPDLVSDFSDTATISSYMLDSPLVLPSDPAPRSSLSKPRVVDSSADNIISGLEVKSKSSLKSTTPDRTTQTLPPNSSCAKCSRRLFSISTGGRYVTVPAEDGTLEHFHSNCFKCAVCGLSFKEAAQGQAIFVRGQYGPSHLECAPPKRVSMGSIPGSPSRKSPVYSPNSSPGKSPGYASGSPMRRSPAPSPKAPPSPTPVSSRYQRPTPTVNPNAFPRFGGSSACPGCHQSVSIMERGVVPGPQGTRWHASCLVCGGKQPVSTFPRGRPPRNPDEPGCGKRLDSAAKTDGDGGVWCRECLLLLSNRASPQNSPTRMSLVPNLTGMQPQLTGTTTLARQFTGVGSGEGSLLRHMTGGGTSPTRSMSPTKQLGDTTLLRQLTGGGVNRSTSPVKQLGLRPRPKSVIGSRSKSIDEGRGMFLVRQMTGTKT
ncbi:hypothetical protein CPB85DRAFT_48719 [Mucidula mucida]|nr:hypothetical protein CPB85DRAFT_48719 [Mucidula mucida]